MNPTPFNAATGPDSIVEFISARGLVYRKRGSEFEIRECPACTGDISKSDNQFKLRINATHGAFHCHRCRFEGGWNEFLRWYGEYSPRPGKWPAADVRAPEPFGKNDTRASAARIWEDSIPLHDEKAELGRAYLKKRALDPACSTSETRFNISTRHSDLNTDLPAVIFRVTDISNRLTGIQRVYLDPQGNKIAENAKKALGSFVGNAIQLDAPKSILHLSEGPENALAIREAIGEPTWSCVSAIGLEKILVPDHVEKIFIWADLDRSETGQNAATALASRMTDSGRTVYTILPPGPIPDESKGIDWLDIYKISGRQALQNAYRAATPFQKQGEKNSAPSVAMDDWPPPLAPEAYFGLVGQIAIALKPHTESDVAAILIQLLAGIGNVIGRGGYYLVEDTRHYTNLFAVLVGDSSKARKGTSWDRIKAILSQVDDGWVKNCVTNGLVSGEGVIHHVRDQKEAHDGAILEHGVDDKRLFVQEGEFAQILKVIKREGNILSVVLRNAWDGGKLSNFSKTSPQKATEVHISIIGHITRNELLRHLNETETANGFGNRFLWLCVRRAGCLPEGGKPSDDVMQPLIAALRAAVEWAKSIRGQIQWAPDAREVWHTIYKKLTDDRPGIYGRMTARDAPQVIRLALVYALMDRSIEIRVEHLSAAIAVWEYCEASCRWIFGDKVGDPDADRLLDALRSQPTGFSRTEISAVYSRKRTAKAIERICSDLVRLNLAEWDRAQNSERGQPRLRLK